MVDTMILFLFVLFFRDRVYLCNNSLACPEPRFIDQVGLD